MRMLFFAGLGMFATISTFKLFEAATDCRSCISPSDGGLGTALVGMGIFAAAAGGASLARARRRARERWR